MKTTLALAALLALAVRNPLAAQTAPAAEQIGEFSVTVRRDPMDDGDRTTATVQSIETTGVEPLLLSWQCTGSRYVAFVDHIPHTSDPTATVIWRFDAYPAMTGHWPARGDHAVVGAELPGFTGIAARATTLVLRVNDSAGEVTASFSLEGAAEALSRLQCLHLPAPAAAH
jgi:hypothetical protein